MLTQFQAAKSKYHTVLLLLLLLYEHLLLLRNARTEYIAQVRNSTLANLGHQMLCSISTDIKYALPHNNKLTAPRITLSSSTKISSEKRGFGVFDYVVLLLYALYLPQQYHRDSKLTLAQSPTVSSRKQRSNALLSQSVQITADNRYSQAHTKPTGS